MTYLIPFNRYWILILSILASCFFFVYFNVKSTTIKTSRTSSLSSDNNPYLLNRTRTSYRTHLEQKTSPISQLVHSPTLTFSNIYVLSLPSRLDRREEMSLLADALGLRITFVDAVNKDEPFIRWIAERVAEVRREKIRLMSKARNVKPSSIGGLEIKTDWLSQTQDLEGLIPFPQMNDLRYYPSGNWITHLESHFESSKLYKLQPLNLQLDVSELLYDPLESISSRQVNEAVISTYWGHTRAIKLMLKNKDKSALILEDDVDLEWELERLWSRIERKLPIDWEMTYLGHCWGQELLKPAFRHPHLHRSSSPLCLHAYTLKAYGASNLLSYLLSPWFAYQTAIDTYLPTLTSSKRINSFSVEPPLIIQRKEGVSDIQIGTGSKWRGVLMDSTMDRIKRDRGEVVRDEIQEEVENDPARGFRYSGKNC